LRSAARSQPVGALHTLALIGGVLPRWLAGVSVVAGILLFLQGFGLRGIIGTYGLVLDLIGFGLFWLFVLIGSAMLLGDRRTVSTS
jgi:hypothetical protein